LSAMQAWIKLECCKLGTAGIMERLRAKKLQGHLIITVSVGTAMRNSFYQQTCLIVYKW